ncbi:hypothetical protein BJ912DRAFT_494061 [Pholiota molesta]|nr:hypothetical protein BJ912DRAFT_494061 [Pholiota molesta]
MRSSCDQRYLQIYRLLYAHTKIIHGDISLNSLMCRKVDGKIYGVLVDYDLWLFCKKSKQGPSSRQRTGARPYMAIDLLQPAPTKHLYRHDLESLFYVIVIFVTRYHGGEKIKNPPLQAWFELPPKSLRHAKLTFLNELPLLPTSAFEILKSFWRIWGKCSMLVIWLNRFVKARRCGQRGG